MRIFVTGGTGFIGSHFLRIATEAGHEITAVRRPGRVPRLPVSGRVEWVNSSLADVPRSALRHCEALVHLAAAGASTHVSDWSELFQCNVVDSLALWRRAAEAGVRRFVICGSCFEYGRSGERYEFIPVNAPLEPTGPYHSSKAAATMAALGLTYEARIECSLLRPFHVYGEGEHETRFWPSLRAAAIAGNDFPMTCGEQVRDFIPVEQVAARFLQTVTTAELRAGQPRIENVGAGSPLSVRHFAETLWKDWNASGKLLLGAIPYRENEVMRYVPLIEPNMQRRK